MSTLCNLMACPWNPLGKNTGVGCHSLLWGDLPNQGIELGLLHCRQILYHLSHQGSISLVYRYTYNFIIMRTNKAFSREVGPWLMGTVKTVQAVKTVQNECEDGAVATWRLRTHSLAKDVLVAGDMVHHLKVRDTLSCFLSGVSIILLDVELFAQRISPTSNSSP